MRVLGCILLLALVPGCWPDFPDSRFYLDASVGGADIVVDGPGNPDGTQDKGQPGDGPQAEGPLSPDARPDFSGTCTPNQFIACVNLKDLQKCNATGDGLELVSCVPFDCNPTHGHCNECKINQPPKCLSGGTVVETCTPEGLLKTTPCPLGCKKGQCCADLDGDTYQNCAGDCNDIDKLVNPGQTAFFAVASAGSFDYNCDNMEEREFPAVVSCVMGSGSCIGSGWIAAVPACGQSGSFADCVDQGGTCIQQPPTTKTQRCR